MPRTITIGRSSSNDFVLDSDMSVSRQHASVTIYDDGRITIRDLNSTSGTYLDGKRITSEEPLLPGSTVKLGNTTLLGSQILASKPHAAVADPNAALSSLTGVKRVGRAYDNDLKVMSTDVSNHHAALGRDANNQIVIVDLNSSNGTFVNGQRISSPKILRPGDRVRLASSDLDWASLFAGRAGGGSGGGKDTSNTRKWLIPAVAAVLVLIAGCLCYYKFVGREWNPQKIYSHYKTSVVMIYSQSTYVVKLNGRSPSSYSDNLAMLDNLYVDGEGDVVPGVQGGFGTGFFISDDGKVMTNKHVLYPVGESANDANKIKDAVESFLYTMAQRTGNMAYAELASSIKVEYEILWSGIALNDTHVSTKDDFIASTPIRKSDNDEVDVAVLQTNTKTTPAGCTIVDINNISDPSHRELGDKVYTIGFPKAFILGQTEAGLEANNQSGEITQERGENVYGHNITIHQGASGSPVFDSYGQFAGIIVSGYLGISQGYNHAIIPEKAVAIVK